GIGGGWSGGGKASNTEVGSVSQDQLLAAAKTDTAGGDTFTGQVAHGCPRFRVWTRDGYILIYEQGRLGRRLGGRHGGEITKTARECQIEAGRVTVRYGFSGRVLLGPKGRTGIVSLPVDVFVTDAKRERILNDKIKVDVDISLDKPIGYFSVVRSLSF